MLSKIDARKLFKNANKAAKNDYKEALTHLDGILDKRNNPREYYVSEAQAFRKALFMELASSKAQNLFVQGGFWSKEIPPVYGLEEKDEDPIQDVVEDEDSHNNITPPIM